MDKLSWYHHAMLAIGLAAGLFILGCPVLLPVNDPSDYSVRESIESTQTQWVQQNSNVGDQSAVATYVADDAANKLPIHQLHGGANSAGLGLRVEPEISYTKTDTTASSFSFGTRGETEGKGGIDRSSRTPTSAFDEGDTIAFLGELPAASTLQEEETIADDHRYREDRVKKNPNRRLTPTPAKEATFQPSNTPTSVPGNTPTLRLPTPTKTQSPTRTVMPTKTATAVPTQTYTPTSTAITLPTEQPVKDIFWSAGFEIGDISEWTSHGGWIQQGSSPQYYVQTSIVHSGQYAVKLTINTSSNTSQAAYLFYWDTLPQAAYYSAWYYIPRNIDTQHWWNIMQWKSTYNGNSDYSRPVFVLDGALFGRQAISLCHLPDKETDKICWRQEIATLPTDQWVHIEVYYERDQVDGRVIVWQDGVQLFDISGYPTVLSDGTLHWSVNHYSDDILPYPASIYLDDIVIAHTPISH